MFRSHYFLAAMVMAAFAVPAVAANDDSSANPKADDSSGVRITEVRNWSVIDTDHDGYVEAVEMERYLQQYWAQKGKNSEAAASSESKNTDTKQK